MDTNDRSGCGFGWQLFLVCFRSADDALPLEFSGGTEIDEIADGFSHGFEIIDQLGFVLGEKGFVRFEFNHDLVVGDEVGFKGFFQGTSFVINKNGDLGGIGDASGGKLGFEGFLIDVLCKTVAEFVVYFKCGGHKVIAFLIKDADFVVVHCIGVFLKPLMNANGH